MKYLGNSFLVITKQLYYEIENDNTQYQVY